MTQSGKTVTTDSVRQTPGNKICNAKTLSVIACYLLSESIITLLHKYVHDVKAPKKAGAIPEKFEGDLLFLIIAVGSDSLSFWVFLLGTLCGFFPDFEGKWQKGKKEDGEEENNRAKDENGTARLEEHENDDQKIFQQCKKIDDDKDAHNDIRDPHNSRELIQSSQSQQLLTESQQLLPAQLISYDQLSNEVSAETKQKPSIENDARPPRGWHVELCLFFVPGFFNCLCVYLSTMGITFVQSATTYSMIKAGRIVWIGFLSGFVFRTRVFGKSQWTGIGIALTGLLIIGCSDGLLSDLELVPSAHNDSSQKAKLSSKDKLEPHNDNSDDERSDNSEDDDRSYRLGVLLLFAGSVCSAFQGSIEEKIYQRLPHTPPMLVVGIEGVFGVFLGVIAGGIMFIFRVPGQLDDFKESVYQLQHCWALWAMFPIYVLARLGAGVSGTSITKSISAAARAVLEYCRVVFFWGIELIVMGCFYSWAKARQEKLDINKFAFWGEKIGFIVVVIGALLFFQLIKPKCWKNNGECGSKEGCCAAKGSKKEESERLEDEYDLETNMGRRSCDSISSEATSSPADTNRTTTLIEMVDSEKFEKLNLVTVHDISMKKRAARSSTGIFSIPQPRSTISMN